MHPKIFGKKIVQLRKRKGLTQDELAEKCHINLRAIQRIESGEVQARAATINLLSDALDYDFSAISNDRIWLFLMHLSSIVPLVAVPLVIWIWKKDDDPDIAQQGIDVLNFQLSMCVYLFSAAILIFVVIGIVILPILGMYCFWITIINVIKLAMDQDYNYPFTIEFFKN